MLLIESNPSDPNPGNNARTLALTCAQTYPHVLQYCYMSRLDFFLLFKTVNQCDQEPYDGNNIDDTQIDPIRPLQQPLLLILQSIFTTPWKALLKLKESLEATKALATFSLALSAGEATTATAMQLDNEQSVSADVMNQLITNKVAEQTKAMKKTLARLTQQVTRGVSKNDTGAANSSGARSKKPNNKRTKDTDKEKESAKHANNNPNRQQNPRKRGSVGGRGNASSRKPNGRDSSASSNKRNSNKPGSNSQSKTRAGRSAKN
jgi:hypothetical protein